MTNIAAHMDSDIFSALNIMLDLETLSTNTNAVILSIGMAAFTIEKGIFDTFYVNLDIDNQITNGGHISADTLIWWMKQTDDARKVFGEKKVSPYDAVTLIKRWFFKLMEEQQFHGMQIWGNGADFDNAILKSACQNMDVATPWHYLNNRCYRTIKSIFSNIPMLPDECKGTYHNALDDAINQANHLIKIFRILNNPIAGLIYK